MPKFTDIHHTLILAQSHSRGDFAVAMERELGYHWDGTLEGKIALMDAYFEKGGVMSDEGGMVSNSAGTVIGEEFIRKMESKLLPILAEMEYTGVRCDGEKLKKIGESIREEIKKLEIEIYEVVGEFFNINSPKQIQVILFEKLGIKPLRKNKTGFSVDNEVLEEIAKNYDIARLILEYRTLAKLESTYIEGLTKAINPITKKIHTTYGQLGAATGRMSSNDPNLQNIPTGKGYPDMIKSCFVPSGDNIFIVADYSQIELRVLAFLSQDHGLLEAFEKNEDIHMRTAKYIFLDRDITSEERRIAKTVNFGVIYGITGFGLSKTLGCSPFEANQYIEAFYARYPRVRAYYDELLADAREVGYVETYFGRRRKIESINDANKMQRSIAEREAMNMPIQGTAADMIKLAMIGIDAKIREKNLRGSMILQVHDELVFDVPREEEEIFTELIRETMENVLIHGRQYVISNALTESKNTQVALSVHDIPSTMTFPPIRVDIHSGMDWTSAKGN
ncbi:MAG: DNA polymerase [Candidatus Gracilibacteria bacterium]|nr:DNA polymerase [Candidatus Gracilibacteria bacterium]